MSQPESDDKLEQLIDLQTQMLHQLTLQQKQQQQIQQGQNCVQLPKLEIMSYNGDKQKFKCYQLINQTIHYKLNCWQLLHH